MPEGLVVIGFMHPHRHRAMLRRLAARRTSTGVAVVIGANDVVNPAARSDPSSPIDGMPVLGAAAARNLIFINRGQGAGFSGIENRLVDWDHCRTNYGDGQRVAGEPIGSIKTLRSPAPQAPGRPAARR